MGTLSTFRPALADAIAQAIAASDECNSIAADWCRAARAYEQPGYAPASDSDTPDEFAADLWGAAQRVADATAPGAELIDERCTLGADGRCEFEFVVGWREPEGQHERDAHALDMHDPHDAQRAVWLG